MEPSLTELRLRNTEAKLKRLIEAATAVHVYLSPHPDNQYAAHLSCGREMLRTAIEEARS